MDVKATALLKLVYLEMVGHDMSWAAFHVLEVMSSPKMHQKRIGYLAAVQSFRADTEVLMLATNLLKKDLGATSPVVMQLPIAALPHVINPSLALSVLPDLLPRLTHSHRVVRKKTIVTLYRLALVYPETLRAAWPRIKERLMDASEDASVTAAIVNVVCELGWRRPRDFLPLAPRLFELLVDGGNNWMAIKLIKLFAQLTPLEPRLVRKLLPPLTDMIRTTPAMSLLYECINGIIAGGILGSPGEANDTSEASREVDEIAELCVAKLRGMAMIEGDTNLKYVALLALNRIVATHAHLVAQQADVILECVDSPDISIRIQALDLVQGMVAPDNLEAIVARLMRQLKQASSAPAPAVEVRAIEFRADPDDADTPTRQTTDTASADMPLPEAYKLDVIARVLHMCARDNYANVADFDWYMDVLTQLLRSAPVPRADTDDDADADADDGAAATSEAIGNELRSVAVKVHALRPAAVRAADAFVAQLAAETAGASPVTSTALKPLAFVVGEYAALLPSSDDTLHALLQLLPRVHFAEVLAVCLQATAKLVAHVTTRGVGWPAERKARTALLLARVVHVLEPLAQHPHLEVQERAVELAELLKLAAEAVNAQASADSADTTDTDAPLLLTEAIPALFRGWELNSVAVHAQGHVPVPDGLDLDVPINANLGALLAEADHLGKDDMDDKEDAFEAYYRHRPAASHVSSAEPAVHQLRSAENASYQSGPPGEEAYLDADILARRRAEREERHRDDPFYIPSASSRTDNATPIHDILQTENGHGLDLDAIPVMKLDLPSTRAIPAQPAKRVVTRPQIVVAADETLGGSGGGSGSGRSTPRAYESEASGDALALTKRKKSKHPLLQVDSSHLGSLSLDEPDTHAHTRVDTRVDTRAPFDLERQKRADAEMAQALKEVERRRLEMQRANERVQLAQGVPVEGAVVAKKPRKKKTASTGDAVVKKKKKSKVIDLQGEPDME